MMLKTESGFYNVTNLFEFKLPFQVSLESEWNSHRRHRMHSACENWKIVGTFNISSRKLSMSEIDEFRQSDWVGFSAIILSAINIGGSNLNTFKYCILCAVCLTTVTWHDAKNSHSKFNYVWINYVRQQCKRAIDANQLGIVCEWTKLFLYFSVLRMKIHSFWCSFARETHTSVFRISSVVCCCKIVAIKTTFTVNFGELLSLDFMVDWFNIIRCAAVCDDFRRKKRDKLTLLTKNLMQNQSSHWDACASYVFFIRSHRKH